MVLITDHAFNSKTSDGWVERGDTTANGQPNFTIVADSTDPRSPPLVGQALFDPMMMCGVGPIFTAPPALVNTRHLYVSFWIKFDPGWVANVANVNKVLFVRIANGNRIIVMAYGGNSAFSYSAGKLPFPWTYVGPAAPMQAMIGLQGMGTQDTTRLPPVPPATVGKPDPQKGISWNAFANLNTASDVLTRGVWHHWEVKLDANTPGKFDGRADTWLDNVQVVHYTNIGYSGPTETGALNTFQLLYWNPTYGGGCNGAWDTVKTSPTYGHPTVPQFPRPQWMRIAHFYASTSP